MKTFSTAWTIVLAFTSLSAFAASTRTVYVYPIQEAKKYDEVTTQFITTDGFSLYVDCGRNTFDDVTHDRVSGFSNSKECRAFVAAVTESLSKRPTEIVLDGAELSIR